MNHRFLNAHFALALAVALACLFGIGARPAAAQCGGSSTHIPVGAPDGGLFGERVAVRGGEIFVGAPGVGRLYVYRRQMGATPYALAGQLVRPAGVTGGHEFGRSIAVDMDVCAVGAPIWGNGQGTVVLYRRDAAGTWTLLQQLSAPTAQPNLYFGSSIAAAHGYLVVGAPGGLNGGNYTPGIAYVFMRQPNGTYEYLRALTPSQPAAQVDGQFGQCVGMSGSTVIVGAPGELYSGDARRGSLYVFERATDGSWPLKQRAKSPTASNTVLAYGIDCAIDGPFITVRQQSSTPGTPDTAWMYSWDGVSLFLEPSFTAGESTDFFFDPVYDAQLTGTMSIKGNYLAIGSRTVNRCDLYVRGAGQWTLQTPYNSGGAGNVELGASVAVGHDILAMGEPAWVAAPNYEPGAFWALAHVSRNCDGDADSDACEVMAQANSAYDDDFDGVPDNCEGTTTPTAAIGSLGLYTDAVAVSWRLVPTAIGYRVQRTLGGTTIVHGWPYASEYVDTTAVPDTLYTYTIRSLDGANGFGSGSISTTGWRAFTAPTGLVASDGTSGAHVALSWNGVSGAPAYRVWRAVGAGTPVEVGQTTGTTLLDATAVAGTVYTYAVTVKGNLGDSPYSNSDTGFVVAIGVPSNVQASDGTSSTNVNVTWNAVSGVNGYKIYRAVGAGAATEIGSVAGSTLDFNDNSATAVVQYSYTVAAVVNGIVGAQGTANTGWRNLPAPTGVLATDGDSTASVGVTWSGVAGSSGYTVWRAPTGQQLVQLASVGAGVLTYDDTSAVAGTQYTYGVRATHVLGSTAQSATDTGWRNLTAPANLAASDGAYADRIRVTWSPVAGATGYRLLRLLPGGTETSLPDIAAGVTQFDDTGVGTLDSVRYRIRALSAPGTTFPSAPDYGWRNAAAPGGLAASDGAFVDRVSVTWSAVAQATSYRVERAVDGGPWTVLGEARPGDLMCSDSQVPALRTCTYRVFALHAMGETAASGTDGGWRNAAAPVAQASDGSVSNGVQVEWPLLRGASAYQVYSGATPESLSLATTVGANVTGWMDATVARATLRYYAVRAVHALGATAVGVADAGWRGLEVPQMFAASDGDFRDHVALTWKTVDLATGYVVQRRERGSDGPYTTFSSIAGSPWNDKSAVTGVRYDYAVAPVCALGTSAFCERDLGWRLGLGASTGSGDAPPAFVYAGDGEAGSAGRPGTSHEDPASDGGTRGPFMNWRDVIDGATQGSTIDIVGPTYHAGSVSLARGSRVTVVLGDPSKRTSTGMVVADGVIQLAGTLRVVVDREVHVAPGMRWVIAVGERIEGAPQRVQLPASPKGIIWRLEVSATQVAVRADPAR